MCRWCGTWAYACPSSTSSRPKEASFSPATEGRTSQYAPLNQLLSTYRSWHGCQPAHSSLQAMAYDFSPPLLNALPGLCTPHSGTACNPDYSLQPPGKLARILGSGCLQAVFRLLVFCPFLGEVIVGKLVSCDASGLRGTQFYPPTALHLLVGFPGSREAVQRVSNFVVVGKRLSSSCPKST